MSVFTLPAVVIVVVVGVATGSITSNTLAPVPADSLLDVDVDVVDSWIEEYKKHNFFFFLKNLKSGNELLYRFDNEFLNKFLT